MIILTKIRAALVAVYRWTGDAGSRRAIAAVLAFILAKTLGEEFDVELIDTILTIALVAFAGAWSSRTNGLAPNSEGAE